MVQRVPDEYFRQHEQESADISAESTPPVIESPAVRAVAPDRVRAGIAPRLLALIVVVAAAAAFLFGRTFLFAAETPELVNPESSSAESLADLAPYDGPVAAVAATGAWGTCDSGSPTDASALVDQDSDTGFRCAGNAIDQSLTFEFDDPAALVGVRLTNGNTLPPQQFLKERRITAVRWTFDDGAFFEQGFAANDPSPQEVRFPETLTGQVTLQILASTEPGNTQESSDAVSITSLVFLRSV